MRIEELVLEGFKSYPVRTSITGWDSSFNAITGLNGSGKSNILDAICFVLGITNMSQMRAQNQQDLIYKRGQAGITKASVTIVFDNSDRATSPVGLETCKQITVTRQIALPNISKYLLNGHKSTQQNVQTLFQGVQLNINNPNFLIMQGKITKVLNMRPQEILGMVEEASGTRMFEERKDKAKKTMGKKEKRVEQITSLLAEEITPKLDTLRAEKRSFLQWQKACSELEKIGRILRAWEWAEGHAKVEKKEAEIATKEKEIGNLKKQQDRLRKETEAAEAQHQEVTTQRDKELKKGGKFKKLEDNVAERGKELVKFKTQLEIKNSVMVDEEKKIKVLETELETLRTAVDDKRNQVEKLNASYTKVKEEHSSLQATLSNGEELLQTLLTGVSSGSSGSTGGGGYMGQIADAKIRLAQATTEEEQSRIQLTMSEKELKTLEGRWKEVEREAGEGTKSLESMRGEVEKLKKKIIDSGWSEEKEQQGQTQLLAAKQEVRQLTTVRDDKKQRLSSLDFNFTSPTPDFDRSKVKGLVASLVSLQPSDYNKSTALEIAAGGKLYNVVVQDERVGKDLLEKGRLKKRVTLIPLNKVEPKRFAAQKVQAANKLAPGKAHVALSLICYPDEVENAMAFVFGDTFICNDAATAKMVTFSKEVGGARSVTLEGDIYDPSGTLSGGSAPSSNGILIKVQELMEIEDKLAVARNRLLKLERDEEESLEVRDKWKSLISELDIKEHGMKLLEQQVGGSNAARLGAEIEALKQTIVDLKASLQTARDKQKAAKDDIKKLEKDMDEFKNNKEGKTGELKTSISKQKAALQKHAVVVKTSLKDTQTATLELQQMEADIESAEQTIVEAETSVAKLRKELGKLTESVATCESNYAMAEKNLQEEKATLTRFDDELKELEIAINKKKDDANTADLKMNKLDHECQTLSKEKMAATNFVMNLEKQYEWILEECESFGKPGTPYDFNAVDIPRMREKAKELEESQNKMKDKINMKVINMNDGVEKREASLKKMLAQVLKDKETIEATIEELDRYKRDALEKTWQKVDGDFGAIFGELLPGNFAKLEPPEGQDLTQGLEVKVRLGTVWKQSLTELSGGQRSLIALSLIMSLLQFKPAPMYILDEIDAALDLSHTQHIGQLFRTRFKGSQFIVVSLKEGLFTNANVLFRTRFRDGTSIVERTAQRSSSALYN